MLLIENRSPLFRYPADASPILAEDIDVLYNGVRFTIPTGFQGDSSVPRFSWRITGAPTTGPNLLAGIIHDYAYSEKLFSRKDCDQLYYEALVSLGKWKSIAWIMWAAVRCFGGSHY